MKGSKRNGSQRYRELRSCTEEKTWWWKKRVACCEGTGMEGLEVLIKFRTQIPCFKEKSLKCFEKKHYARSTFGSRSKNPPRAP
jgi:hypothetical protein